MAKVTAPFTQAFLDNIKLMLLDERVRLQKELSHVATKPNNAGGAYETTMSDYGDKDDENALEVAEYTTNKPLEITLEKTLRDVEKSLERLEKGGYGICKYCDQPIDEKRLMARATSSACVSCKKTLTDEA